MDAKVCSLRTTSAGICRRRGGPNVCSLQGEEGLFFSKKPSLLFSSHTQTHRPLFSPLSLCFIFHHHRTITTTVTSTPPPPPLPLHHNHHRHLYTTSIPVRHRFSDHSSRNQPLINLFVLQLRDKGLFFEVYMFQIRASL
ncbi:hypothetical protein HanIR_Chr12g0570151 [Helianthus annuus]|nr:hypothetical protein HanIR_Chr12g0570151 [Helianthus annuus]